MKITPLASSFTDNFMYLVVDGDEALLVDPIDAETAVDAARASGAKRFSVVATHGHQDHVAGNAQVKAALGARVLASSRAESFPTPHDVALEDCDSLLVGTTAFDVIHAPGHTDGHIALYTPGHLISGDILFVAGVGNCRFGGDPGVLFRTIRERLGPLPDDTVFYPGHDYARKNLEFILSIEPANARAAELLDEVRGWSRSDGPYLTTLGTERAYNPFFRAGDPALAAALEPHGASVELPDVDDPAEQAFRTVRALRDRF